MKAGKIDAFIVAEPFGAKAQLNGVGRILLLTKDIVDNHVECIVIVTKTSLEALPVGVQEWVHSSVRAGKFIDEDKNNNGSKEVARLGPKSFYLATRDTPTRATNWLGVVIVSIDMND